MENTPRFDLSDAIRRWREGLANSTAFGLNDLEELENHLRESAAELQARGFSAEEAFAVASARLGDEERLAQEYAKSNPERIWTTRAVWMLCGLLASLALGALVNPVVNLVLNVGFWRGWNAQVIGATHVLAGLAATLSWIGLGSWLVVRNGDRLSRAADRCLRRPFWTAVGLVLGLESVQLLSARLVRFLGPLWEHLIPNLGRPVPPARQAIVQTWFGFDWLLMQLLWVASVPLLAAYLSRSSRKSRLVASRQLWLERGFWMVVGVVVARALGFLGVPFWALLVVNGSAPAAVQHLTGLAAMCLGLMPVVMAGVVWKIVSRGAGRRFRARRFGHSSPVRGAVLFAMVCIGLGTVLYFLGRAISSVQLGPIEARWFTYNAFVTNLLLPAALLVWLAKRLERQTAR